MKLIFGCGYLGQRVAQLWKERGNNVGVVTRSEKRARQFEQQGYQTWIADITRAESLENLPNADSVLFCVGYDPSQALPIHDVYVEGLKNVLTQLPACRRFIYTSSTGVFGSTSQEWLTEASPCTPQLPGGKACLDAEQVLQNSALSNKTLILRLAGIYGPNRVPRLSSIRSGTPIPCTPENHLNLIHVEDAARIICSLEETASLPNLYLVSDGNPVQRGKFYQELAKATHSPTPQFLPPRPGTRGSEDKKISNRKLLSDLSIPFQFPSYQDFLSSLKKVPKPTSP